MGTIEELIYSALEHGKRTDLLKKKKKIRTENPHIPLEDAYDRAYKNVMKT